MKKLRGASMKRLLAGGSALGIFGLILVSALMTLLAVRPAPVQAQSATFTWINASTLRVGDQLFTDPDIQDGKLWFESSSAGRCSYADAGIENISSDRVLVTNDKKSGTRFVVDPNAKSPSGAPTCKANQTKLTAENMAASEILWYRSKDTVYPVSNAVQFNKTATRDLGNSKDVEIFTRVGESSAPCPDIITHGTGGDWNGWIIFPMAPEGTANAEEDPSRIVSEHYEQIFPDKNTCVRAAKEIATVFNAGTAIYPGCSSPDDTTCGGETVSYPDDQYKVIWFDDAFKIQAGVGTEENAPDPEAATEKKPDEIKKTACDQSFGFVDLISLKWIVCPVVNIIMTVVDLLEDLLVSQMKIDPAPLTDGAPYNGAYHRVWGTLRSIALAIIVIVALVMVIFEAAGIEAFSAYTMRTLFTRFGVAVLFIVLSWTFLGELINVINGLIDGARTLIYAPFNAQFGPNNLETGSSVLMLMLGTGGVLALGPWGLLSFVATAALSVAITLLVLVLVHTVIYILIMFSPIAIALSVLPNTRKGYEFWKNSLFSLLLGLVAVAFAMPAIDVIAEAIFHLGGTINQITGLLLKLLRAFIILWIFARIGGAAAMITGAINDRTRGGFDRLRNFRRGQMQSRHEGRMKGEANTFGSANLTKAYQRVAGVGQGGLSFTRRGRARYNAGKQDRMTNVADEMLKKDGGRYSGDDDAMALALQKGMTERQFVNEYARMTGSDAATARATLAGLENSFGAKLGSDAMRVAAFKARASSKTGYNLGSAKANYNAIASDAGSLMNDGLITQADAVAIVKGNKERVDQSGIGFNSWFKAMGKARAQYSNGVRGGASDPIFDDNDVANLQDDALIGASPGQLIGGYHLGVSAIAPAMGRRMQKAAAAAADPNLSQDQRAAAWRDLQQQVGAYKARHQLSPQVSEKIQGIYADVGNQKIMGPGNKEMSVRELSEMLSSGQQSAQAGVDNSYFLDAVHVYAGGSVKDYNEALARSGGGGAPIADNATTDAVRQAFARNMGDFTVNIPRGDDDRREPPPSIRY